MVVAINAPIPVITRVNSKSYAAISIMLQLCATLLNVSQIASWKKSELLNHKQESERINRS
jgi:hypothetical protein